MSKVKCEECGYTKQSKYEHDVCPHCKGSMHSGKIATVVVKDIKETLRLLGEK